MYDISNQLVLTSATEENDYSYAIAYDSNNNPFLWLGTAAYSDDYSVYNNLLNCCTEFTGTFEDCQHYMLEQILTGRTA